MKRVKFWWQILRSVSITNKISINWIINEVHGVTSKNCCYFTLRLVLIMWAEGWEGSQTSSSVPTTIWLIPWSGKLWVVRIFFSFFFFHVTLLFIYVFIPCFIVSMKTFYWYLCWEATWKNLTTIQQVAVLCNTIVTRSGKFTKISYHSGTFRLGLIKLIHLIKEGGEINLKKCSPTKCLKIFSFYLFKKMKTDLKYQTANIWSLRLHGA